MRNSVMFIFWVSFLVMESPLSAIESQKAQAFVGQDLHLSGQELISVQSRTGEHILVFQDGLIMSIGANRFSSDSAVVWLKSVKTEFGGRVCIDYKVIAYLQGNVQVKKAKGAKTTQLSQTVAEEGQAMIAQFEVSGEVFVTVKKKEIADPRGLELYIKAVESCRAIGIDEKFVVEAEPVVPAPPAGMLPPKPKEKKIRFRYPVNIAPLGKAAPKIQWDQEKAMGTVVGRFYLWQKQDEQGGLLELQANNAVIWYAGKEKARFDDILSRGAVSSIYLSGDVVYTCGQRTIRADQLYYDFQRKKALAINAAMRNFDVSRGVPIYVRAQKLRQVAENKFAADDITLTTSEFHLPQISLNASEVIITDTTSIDEQQGKVSDSSYDALMRDVRLKVYDKTIFYWPVIRSNLQRPDIPLKSAHTGYDRYWGMILESRWYLARLLGRQEPKGTDSTLAFDYYSRRGVGVGAEIDYSRENYFGRMLGYMIHDRGEDRLGRHSSRRHLKPPRKLRGRFRWQHRHFLPYNWQLTSEVSYASDKHFIEGYYRREFNIGKEQETLVHLKRIEDNWGLSFLGKARINNFVNKLEELPTVEFHWTGQSLFDDKFTFYSDSQVSRFRQRYASDTTAAASQQFFTFMSERAELDMPMTVGDVKAVPFVAGTVAYEDWLGFYRKLDGATASSKDNIWIGEAGARVSPRPLWKVYPDIKSELWDVNQLRHIIQPWLTLVGYTQSDAVAEQRDTLNVGITQRLQTKRGPVDKQQTVDWMRLDVDFTWVNNSGDTSSGPDRFIWNKPFIPLVNRFSTTVPPQDRRSSDVFGPRRNYMGADYIWRLSDTTAVLSDMNFDMQSGVVQQYNIGFSHLRWPNLSYYIGSRYLRRVEVLGEKGSNAFTFAATYVLDPRYTAVFSQQFDFDYGASIRSDITLIRRYHRLYYALTYSADESLDSHAIMFSIWPEGIPELALGPRRYIKLAKSAGY